jgi:hypothetical protein
MKIGDAVTVFKTRGEGNNKECMSVKGNVVSFDSETVAVAATEVGYEAMPGLIGYRRCKPEVCFYSVKDLDSYIPPDPNKTSENLCKTPS